MYRLHALSVVVACLVHGGASGAEPGALLYVPHSTQRICQLTGDFDRAVNVPTLSQTGRRFGLLGTDLGSSFEHKGKLGFLFGDTFGRPGARDVLGWTDSTDPTRIVLQFYRAPDNKWLPLTVPGIKQGAFEVPSGGISVGGAIFVVCTTDHSEDKTMGRSVLAVSRDDGRTFRLIYELSQTKFINVSFWLDDDWLYIFGSGDYRKSNVFLARVRPADLSDRSRLEYFSGVGDASPHWSPQEDDAVALFEHPQVGEFSVSHLKPVNCYVMLYNALNPRGIIMRSSETPWGPWSEGTVIFEPTRDNGYGYFMHIKNRGDGLSAPNRGAEWGGEYGPYIMSRYTVGKEGHCAMYYTMSTWNPYQVMVMRSELKLVDAPTSSSASGVSQSPTDPDRRAAEAMLALGGSVSVGIDGVEREIPPGSNLPSEPFELTRVRLNGHHGLSDSALKPLEGASHVISVNLTWTGVTDAGLSHLRNVTKLRSLMAQGAQITGAGLDHLQGLPELEHLLVGNTRLTDADLRHLRGLTSLKHLGLSATRITNAGLANVKSLTGLRSLWLSKTRVSDSGLMHLKYLPALTGLDLSETHITNAGLANLAGLKNLRKLDLRGTKVTDTGLEKLKDVTLEELNLTDTKVTAAGVEGLQKTIPTLKILANPKAP